ncbi:hypothetical protein B1L11_38075 [Microbispora sp. GKU 823]|nr:hypothetical protein B1L11_38075 [Microbispora sp. GKU 823]
MICSRSHIAWKRSIASSTVHPYARRRHLKRVSCGQHRWISSAIWWKTAVVGGSPRAARVRSRMPPAIWMADRSPPREGVVIGSPSGDTRTLTP